MSTQSSNSQTPSENALTTLDLLEQTVVQSNPRPRCPVMLLLDCSTSMTGKPIQALTEGLGQFIHELHADNTAQSSVELSVITFGYKVQQICPFTAAGQICADQLPALRTDGATPMGQAIHMGMRELKNHKNGLRNAGVPYYQPWLVVMTDGMPNDDWKAHADYAKQEAQRGKLITMGVGIGPDADMDMLDALCTQSLPPVRLNGLRFSDYFRWLSQTLRPITRDSTEKQPHIRPSGPAFAGA